MGSISVVKLGFTIVIIKNYAQIFSSLKNVNKDLEYSMAQSYLHHIGLCMPHYAKVFNLIKALTFPP